MLEDLEYYDDVHEEDQWRVLNPERHLGHVRATLRRLCYSMVDTEPWSQPSDGDGDAGRAQRILDLTDIDLEAKMDMSGLSFSSFPVLEQLELEQLLLYGPVFPTLDDPAEDRSSRLTNPEDFLVKMPPSLRRLRVGCIIYWPTIYRDLLALAKQASRFPQLRTVDLEVCKPPPQDEHRHLVEMFRALSNISVSVCQIARHPGSRGLLPARPGQPEVVLEPLVNS